MGPGPCPTIIGRIRPFEGSVDLFVTNRAGALSDYAWADMLLDKY
jgi:hypothetical protein